MLWKSAGHRSGQSSDHHLDYWIVKRAAETAGFKLLPRRWVVERTLAWLNRNRRLAKDFEASIASAKAWVYITSVQVRGSNSDNRLIKEKLHWVPSKPLRAGAPKLWRSTPPFIKRISDSGH